MNRQRFELPDDKKETELVAKALLNHPRQMNKEFGWVFQVNDLQVRSSSAECPFVEPDPFGGA